MFLYICLKTGKKKIMTGTTQGQLPADEVNLLYYLKKTWKRKALLTGTFLVITVGTALVNFLLPRIYRGEFNLIMAVYSFSEIIERVNSNEKERLRTILPSTYQSVNGIKLAYTGDSVIYRLNVIIEAKDTADIRPIMAEFIQYINDMPYYKKSVEEKKVRLQIELNELSKAIEYPQEILKTYGMLLKSEKLVPIVFNPVDLHKGMVDLIKRKVSLEQTLKNYSGIEIITEEIYPSSVKPDLKRNLPVAALLGILAGFLMVIIVELKIKVSGPSES